MTVTDTTAAPPRSRDEHGRAVIGVTAGELLAALDTVAPHTENDHPAFDGAWLAIGQGRLRITATDRFTVATTHTPATAYSDDDGAWSGRVAGSWITRLRDTLGSLPDWQNTEPFRLSGDGEHLTITGLDDPIDIAVTDTVLPEAFATLLPAATVPVPAPAVGFRVSTEHLARFAAMNADKPVYAHIAANPTAKTGGEHMLVLSSRSAMGIATLVSGDSYAESVQALWSDLHPAGAETPEAAGDPESVCALTFAGVLVCTLDAAHEGPHRHTNGRTWRWYA